MYGISSSRKRISKPHQAAFGLALFAEEQHVVLGEERDVDFGDDGAVVADDAGKKLFAVGSMRRKLSWISCLTVLETQPLSRSSRRVGSLAVVVRCIAALTVRVWTNRDACREKLRQRSYTTGVQRHGDRRSQPSRTPLLSGAAKREKLPAITHQRGAFYRKEMATPEQKWGLEELARTTTNRQFDGERGALADGAFDADAAVVGFDDVAAGERPRPVPPLPLASGPALVE